jgi:proteasome alpha subunit
LFINKMSGMYFAGYDRAITMFSPDGRIYQLEYAMEPVKKGSTTMGIKVDEGVAIVAERIKPSPLVDVSAPEKVLLVDRHIGVGYAGLSSDARVLIEDARVYAQTHRIMYDEDIDVEALTKRMGDVMQAYTQHGGTRPFGVAFITAGISRGVPKLFMTDVSGAYTSYKAVTIGMYDQAITDFFKDRYTPSMSIEQAVLTALQALRKAKQEALQTSVAFDPEKIEAGVARRSTGLFVKLTQAEVSSIIDKLEGSGLS